MSSVVDKVRKEAGVCGIGNIPNQLYHLTSYQNVVFNVLLMGEVSGGKTSFINRVLGNQKIIQNKIQEFIEETLSTSTHSSSSKVQIRKRQQNLTDDGINATIRLIDVPQVGHSISKLTGYRALCDYTRDQLLAHLKHEQSPNRATLSYADNRVHVCLYFLTPHQDRLSKVDIAILQEISKLTSVLLIAGKDDLLTTYEYNIFANRVIEQCNQHKISLFTSAGSNSIGRVYPTSNRSSMPSNFAYLEEALLGRYLPKLIEDLEVNYYEEYCNSVIEKLNVTEEEASPNTIIAKLQSLTI